MNRLPHEIYSEVAFHVSRPSKEPDYAIRQVLSYRPPRSQVADLKRLRRVNHAFRNVTAEYLFSEILLLPNTASYDRLRIISQHPKYNKYVKALRYETSIKYRSSGCGASSGSSLKPDPNCDAGNLYDEKLIPAPMLISTNQAHSEAKVQRCLEKYCICEVALMMERFPDLGKLVVDKSANGPRGPDRAAMYDKRTLLECVSSADIKFTQFECHNVSCDDLLLPGQYLKSINTMFENLQSLHLSLYGYDLYKADEDSNFQKLSDILSTTKNLRSLALYVRQPVYGLDLGQLIGNQGSYHYWPALEELILNNFKTEERVLVEFLANHSNTLRTLSLGLFQLEIGSWDPTLRQIRTSMNLVEFDSPGEWYEEEHGGAWDVQAYRVHGGELVKTEDYDLAMAIRRFLLHGRPFHIREWESHYLKVKDLRVVAESYTGIAVNDRLIT